MGNAPAPHLRIVEGPDFRCTDEPPPGYREETITVAGQKYVVCMYPTPPPPFWFWEARLPWKPFRIMAQCICTRAGDRDPVRTARRYLRRLPRECLRCRAQHHNAWCEVWRVGPGNWERMTKEERRIYEDRQP